MKSTGIVRKIDELGRLVIPKELRRTLDIEEDKDYLEIYTDGNMIVLKKYEPHCVFCDNVNNVVQFNGKNVCNECAEKIGRLYEND